MTKHKYQTKHNNRNSKSQTIGFLILFKDWNLEFICHLVLVICYFGLDGFRCPVPKFLDLMKKINNLIPVFPGQAFRNASSIRTDN